MKIFVAGAAGVIGRRLIQRLTGNGYDVVSLVRRPEEFERIQRFGAEPVQVDVFDRGAVRAVLDRVRPDAVIDELASLPKSPADSNNAFSAGAGGHRQCLPTNPAHRHVESQGGSRPRVQPSAAGLDGSSARMRSRS